MEVMKIRKEGRCGYYRTHESRVTNRTRLRSFRTVVYEYESTRKFAKSLAARNLAVRVRRYLYLCYLIVQYVLAAVLGRDIVIARFDVCETCDLHKQDGSLVKLAI
jgi:predicted anti-sigma-YlaC factor YlaD